MDEICIQKHSMSDISKTHENSNKEKASVMQGSMKTTLEIPIPTSFMLVKTLKQAKHF